MLTVSPRFAPTRHSFKQMAHHTWHVEWSGKDQQLAVSLSRPGGGDRGRVVWTNKAGTPFAAAGFSDSIAAEAHGNFQIRERLLWQCVQQQVEGWTAAEEELLVEGSFQDDARCADTRWQLRLAPTDQPEHLRSAPILSLHCSTSIDLLSVGSCSATVHLAGIPVTAPHALSPPLTSGGACSEAECSSAAVASS